ncbi:hypothetical protein FQR65_LT20600 [Abscondita terminalis]|nr:hypothetical protein FQR65_LT20600 [Abscondita terminalis]
MNANASCSRNSWLRPITNENNEVLFDDDGNIMVYNVGNNCTTYVSDTIENRNLLQIPLQVSQEEEEEEGSLCENEDSQLRENKWTHERILLLLAFYEDHIPEFKSSKKTNKAIWAAIAKQMNDNGYHVTGEQCDIKFRNLKKTYKRIKDNNSSTGAGAISWPYFSNFDNIFGHSHDINPQSLVSNINGYTACQSLSSPTLPSDEGSNNDVVDTPIPVNKKKRFKSGEEEPN